LKLRNLMEEAVYQAIEEAQKNYQFCTCEKCKMDIAAIALNQLPPRYLVTERGDAYARTDLIELQKYLDVLSTVIKAINTVSKRPHHH